MLILVKIMKVMRIKIMWKNKLLEMLILKNLYVGSGFMMMKIYKFIV